MTRQRTIGLRAEESLIKWMCHGAADAENAVKKAGDDSADAIFYRIMTAYGFPSDDRQKKAIINAGREVRDAIIIHKSESPRHVARDVYEYGKLSARHTGYLVAVAVIVYLPKYRGLSARSAEWAGVELAKDDGLESLRSRLEL